MRHPCASPRQSWHVLARCRAVSAPCCLSRAALPAPPRAAGRRGGGGHSAGGGRQRGAAHPRLRGAHPQVRARIPAGACQRAGDMSRGRRCQPWGAGCPHFSGEALHPRRLELGRVPARLRRGFDRPAPTCKAPRVPCRLAASPCGKFVAGYGQDSTIHIWTSGALPCAQPWATGCRQQEEPAVRCTTACTEKRHVLPCCCRPAHPPSRLQPRCPKACHGRRQDRFIRPARRCSCAPGRVQHHRSLVFDIVG